MMMMMMTININAFLPILEASMSVSHGFLTNGSVNDWEKKRTETRDHKLISKWDHH